MPNVTANGIQIEYDTFGDQSSSPILLIMGLGGQMINWPEKFCEELAERGHFVIRYDNRDVGLSTKFEGASLPRFKEIFAAAQQGKEIDIPYKMEDMADDAVGLIQALGIAKAHVCGVSMGGMIAQTVAFCHPSNVLSLISIMSTTGDPNLPPGKPEAQSVLLTPAPHEREAYIEFTVKNQKIVGSSSFKFDETMIRDQAARTFDRAFYPQGFIRQYGAVLAQGSRKTKLACLKVPTLVIHGTDDPLITLEGGKDTANTVPGAELLIIEGMGHDLHPETWSRIIDAIKKHTYSVENR